MTSISPVRPSPIAGMWYEGNPKALKIAIERYLDQAELPELPGKVIAVVAPHAGHQYSGPVAGYAFAAVRGQAYDLVAILSPMHQPYYQSLLTTAHEFYSTPLGDVPVDKKMIVDLDDNLRSLSGESLTPVAYDQEHSLEIEIPFLQIALAQEFKILPVMVRSQSAKVSKSLGEALARTIQGGNVLVVASTDLSHFYTQKEAIRFDTEMLRRFHRKSSSAQKKNSKDSLVDLARSLLCCGLPKPWEPIK
jgi:AmmeMemoRadiSam system protein B